MAVLLRASGVATRLVNGFHGGKWNRFGNYVAVSHGDAHSWVEVATIHKDCKGEVCKQSLVWVRFDPTPAARSRSSAGVFDLLRAYADAFRMRWYKHVIEYDVEQQAGALSRLRDFWNDVRSSEPLMKSIRKRTQSAVWFARGCSARFHHRLAHTQPTHAALRENDPKRGDCVDFGVLQDCLRFMDCKVWADVVKKPSSMLTVYNPV